VPWGGTHFKCDHIKSFQSLLGGLNDVGRKGRLGREWSPAFFGKLHLVRFVIEKQAPIKVYGVLLCDGANDFRRVKQPVAIVLPIIDVIRKIIVNAVTNGIDINDVW
jgi:hypothetical protein